METRHHSLLNRERPFCRARGACLARVEVRSESRSNEAEVKLGRAESASATSRSCSIRT